MIVVGVTGNIASGKTNISNFIKRQNIPVHDSDVVVTNLYKNSSVEFVFFLRSIGLARAINRKKINKNIVRQRVLNNKKQLEKLEKFVHKKVRISRDKFIEKNLNLGKKIIVLDIPLLFEKKLENICDYIFLAYSPIEIRLSRALKRKNINDKSLKKFIELQIPDKLKISKSDFVINTSKTKAYSNTQILNAIKKIKSLSET